MEATWPSFLLNVNRIYLGRLELPAIGVEVVVLCLPLPVALEGMDSILWVVDGAVIIENI